VKYYDQAGNVSTIFSKSIILDTAFKINGGAASTLSHTLDLTIGSGNLGPNYQMYFSISDSTGWHSTAFEPYQQHKTLTVSGIGNVEIYATIYNSATGSSCLTSSIAIYTEDPVLTLTSSAGTQFTLNGNVVYDRSGYGGGGRGINVAVLNSMSGIEMTEIRNFDTWLHPRL